MTMDGSQLAPFLTAEARRIHLIGVAGSGMSGIAGLCISLGHRVSGSDKATTIETARLQTLGLDFSSPANPAKVGEAELVIYSSAIKPGHADFDAAVKLGIPMVRRADALAAIMRQKKGIVIAGDARKDDDEFDGGSRLASRWGEAVALCRRGDSHSWRERALGPGGRVFCGGGG